MKSIDGQKRIVIEGVTPQVNCGAFPVKRVLGERVVVHANIFSDGHDQVRAELLHKFNGAAKWTITEMVHLVNDEWEAAFQVRKLGTYAFTVRAWVDHFETWRRDIRKKWEAGQNVDVDLMVGAELIEQAAQRAPRTNAAKLRRIAKSLKAVSQEEAVAAVLDPDLRALVARYPDRSLAMTCEPELHVRVNRKKALFSAWYELFPRSCGTGEDHGTFADCEKLLPDIAKLGFDVLYLPPIHPIGHKHRKGRNNLTECGPEDPGSPWAIGSSEGGHKAIHPELGDLKDFRRLIRKAKKLGLEIAMDMAFQCAPDHPYVKKHPKWFRWRPDGTVQYAENPPKKYEDILPLDFETDNWKELWEELKSVVLFWVQQGVRIFRVDNPHTKPFGFWDWLIGRVKDEYPDTIFLAEAFTRPKLMNRLAKLGFDQSYTYFTWRNTKYELTEYLNELTAPKMAECFRPNFWPNTPDILPQYLQYGGRAAFIARFVLAATLSSNYGIYGPAFELCVSEAVEGKEEYLNSEKYEIKDWKRKQPGDIRGVIERVNRIRRENPALQSFRNLRFYNVENDMLLCYGKISDDLSNVIITLVSLDPYHKHGGMLHLPLDDLGIDPGHPFLAHDLLSNDKYIWQGCRNYVELDPQVMPAHILRVHRRLRRETDFDYFM